MNKPNIHVNKNHKWRDYYYRETDIIQKKQ